MSCGVFCSCCIELFVVMVCCCLLGGGCYSLFFCFVVRGNYMSYEDDFVVYSIFVVSVIFFLIEMRIYFFWKKGER